MFSSFLERCHLCCHPQSNKDLLPKWQMVTSHYIIRLSSAEVLTGCRIHSHLYLFHQYILCNVIEKQDELSSVTRHSRKFAIGDRFACRNFKGRDKLITVTVTRISAPVSYQVQTSSSTIQRSYVDQLWYQYFLNSDDQESNDFNYLPFSCTTSTTYAPLNLEQGHGQSEVALSTTSSLQCSNRTWKPVYCYGPYLSI